jgi:hypothetical protein
MYEADEVDAGISCCTFHQTGRQQTVNFTQKHDDVPECTCASDASKGTS